MLENFKLRHLDLISQEKVNYALLMQEIMGYENRWFNRKSRFVKSFNETIQLIEQIKNIVPKQVKLNPDCKIKYPSDIDEISFLAMMEIRALRGNHGDRLIGELMADMIAIACYSSNCTQIFDMNSLSYRSLKSQVLNSSVGDMIGLFNWITQALEDSDKIWEERFFKIAVEDQDYVMAGGELMNQFNIIATIENICLRLNYTEKEAWQVPYVMTQMLSYKNAAQAFVQDNMRRIKERKMKSQRKTNT